MSLKELMRAVRAAEVELRISGADVLISGLDKLPPEMQAELERLRRSGFLWSWCGADDDDEEAIDFADRLLVDVVLVEGEEQAQAAIRELSSATAASASTSRRR